MIIYKATSPSNRSYIGLTTYTMKKRMGEHKSSMKNPKFDKFKFHRALKKYGFDGFKWEVIYTTNCDKDLKLKEQYYIGYYNSYENGYNCTLGGDGVFGRMITDDMRKNWSKKAKIVSNLPEVKAKTKGTWFKKGQLSHNARFVVDHDGNIFDSVRKAAMYYKVSYGRLTVAVNNKKIYNGNIYLEFLGE